MEKKLGVGSWKLQKRSPPIGSPRRELAAHAEIEVSWPQSRSIARQESRLLWLVEGNAPTKFFHLSH